ncbi:MAG: glycosyltransferase family 39 protein [Candidatus Bathyarchaeota archaeon]
MTSRSRISLFIVLLVGLILRLYWALTAPIQIDESLYCRAGEQYLIGNYFLEPNFPEYYNLYTNLEHPPLAKYLLGIPYIQTHSVIASRFVSIFFSLIYLLSIYLLSKELGGIPFPTTVLASFEAFTLAISATASLEIFFMTFTLLSILSFIKKKYVLSGIFLGLGIASKWWALYVVLILLSYALLKRTRWKTILTIILIGAITYILSYSHFILLYGIGIFLWLQNAMFTFFISGTSHSLWSVMRAALAGTSITLWGLLGSFVQTPNIALYYYGLQEARKKTRTQEFTDWNVLLLIWLTITIILGVGFQTISFHYLLSAIPPLILLSSKNLKTNVIYKIAGFSMAYLMASYVLPDVPHLGFMSYFQGNTQNLLLFVILTSIIAISILALCIWDFFRDDGWGILKLLRKIIANYIQH